MSNLCSIMPILSLVFMVCSCVDAIVNPVFIFDCTPQQRHALRAFVILTAFMGFPAAFLGNEGFLSDSTKLIRIFFGYILFASLVEGAFVLEKMMHFLPCLLAEEVVGGVLRECNVYGGLYDICLSMLVCFQLCSLVPLHGAIEEMERKGDKKPLSLDKASKRQGRDFMYGNMSTISDMLNSQTPNEVTSKGGISEKLQLLPHHIGEKLV
mmetsp:Transcript_102423/g.228717  ORF Transcript_102423/g.228717 Transcript_102423/m.228717 type:complete len:210 (-) Transcript_102423:46-675(-)